MSSGLPYLERTILIPPPLGSKLPGISPPTGPSENRGSALQSQETALQSRWPRRLTRKPRTRRCLLKGCERRYRPRCVLQMYCSSRCREVAREWSLWKAQVRYRATAGGQAKRRAQSQRYRERLRRRKEEGLAAVTWQRGPSVQIISEPHATGLAATSVLCQVGGRHCNGSVRRHVGELWNASGSGSRRWQNLRRARVDVNALPPKMGYEAMASDTSCP